MRLRVVALLAAAIGLALIPAVAEAGHRRHHHHGAHKHHHYKFYHKHYRSDWDFDRYAYGYSPRGYYPYYNSGHWRPTHELRYRRHYYRPYAALPPYYQAWGYPQRYYSHRKWHRHHHGRHRHHHW